MFGALALVAALAASALAADGGAKAPPCVTSRGETRYAVGYNHYVVLTNACTATQVCRVTTDVNPEAIVVDVPGGATVEVLTFRGSPASTFQHRADCQAK